MEQDINRLLESVTHPYARYGLGIVCSRLDSEETPSAEGLRKALIASLENGIEHFRMESDASPESSDTLQYRAIHSERYDNDLGLIFTAGMSTVGRYLYPTIITLTSGKQQGQAIKATFSTTLKKLFLLSKPEVDLSTAHDLQRSFAPTVSKFNGGNSSQREPFCSLLEASCSAVTTITPYKPAVFMDSANTTIIPDLPIEKLKTFIQVFREMQSSGTNSLMRTTVRIDQQTGERSYSRPPIFNGNYPNAPYNSDAFGAVGLLAAIGEWAKIAEEEQRMKALEVLGLLTDCPLYIVSYDGIAQARFSHHVVGLAKMARLYKVVNDLYFSTQFYADANVAKAKMRDKRKGNDYQLFYKMASRFLQSFDTPSLRDFLAFRTEYAPSLKALWSIYFMEKQNIPEPVVSAARALGQWINYAAYRTAADENEGKPDVKTRIRQDKAKILAEFESAVFSAKDAPDLLSRVSVRAGRLLGQDAPYNAQAFYDAALMETIKLTQAQQMLVAYMRLRSAYTKAVEADEPVDAITYELPDEDTSDETIQD